ncbi:Rieske (2Fe-2S) protein [Sphingobium lactosutens]|uniref:aromatic ring-hydroxylating dioxygenase subunit alpha n=1 Tax=Sphingobium lactosutens TaxID=522773 RepID=UPI0015B948BA|nr:aromatic ring-hydroxylating dioxygenase subunit alpha [Sphingobium lactosutens]NWK96213.1 Rieske (2Fe-2S) protein [Sphingobium lactosutens]
MFLKDCWYVAAWSKDVSDGLLPVKIIGQPVVLYRLASGEAIALEDRCVHRLAPLSCGKREGDDLRCMYHGLRFAPDGRCVEIPGQDIIPPIARVYRYPVTEKGGWVWIWPGDPQLADAGLVPDVIGPGNPDWKIITSQIDYDAHADLVIDNLLDFSHLTYVHANSFAADKQWAEKRPKVERIERGLRVSRWLSTAPAMRPALTLYGQPVDTYQTYDFIAPGILTMQIAFCEPGSQKRSDDGPPVDGILRVNGNSQAVTPIDDHKTRYFFGLGSRSADTSDEQVNMIGKVGLAAFTEDRQMIEGQQQIMNISPGVRPMPTNADIAITHFHSIIRELAKQEAARMDGSGTTA